MDMESKEKEKERICVATSLAAGEEVIYKGVFHWEEVQ